MTAATEAFEAERPRLFGLAYRMLGSVIEAEDVVQEAWLRWDNTDVSAVESPAAFLRTVTSRLALDRLKSAQRNRERYIGPWLPEPLPTTVEAPPGPEDTAVMRESLTLGFLAVLERLTPLERAVFLLREVFDLSYRDVAASVERSEETCRQIARRARAHVRTERRRILPDLERDQRLIEALVGAVASGDPDGLAALLRQDVVLVTDGGGKIRAARHPIVGVDKVAHFLLGVSSHYLEREDITIEPMVVNGQPSVLVAVGEEPPTLFTVEIRPGEELISQVLAVRNPDKLARIRAAK